MGTEQEMVRRLSEKDPAGLEMIYDRYSASLFGIAVRITGSETIARDILQDVFLKAWNKADVYNPSRGSLFTWLLNICRNASIDHLRDMDRQRYFREQYEESGMTSSSRELKTDHIGLHDMVSDLDKDCREIIDLVYFNGFTQREVSEYLRIPLGTVKSRIRRAMKTLRLFFTEEKSLTGLSVITLLLQLYG